MKIETPSGIYEIRRPVGRIGAQQIAIITAYAPQDSEDSLQTGMGDMFLKWSIEILPKILVNGPFVYEEMPGEDQMAIFIAVCEKMNLTDDFFRVIE